MRQVVKSLAVLAMIAGVAAPSVVMAQDAGKAVKARQATMQLYSHYLGQLGAMAKGETPYDADKAGSLAASLASVASIDQSAMWPQGSDNETLGDMTRALPAIWTTFPAIMKNGEALGTAVTALNASAGSDLDGLRAAMGGVGKACGDCHKAFRQPKN